MDSYWICSQGFVCQNIQEPFTQAYIATIYQLFTTIIQLFNININFHQKEMG